ncbi:MAG: tRNA (N6-isopentenyl adenosine(37)-C2)-methylthiotransferase MiaB [Planctomycetota bacterium]|jgi:tRNA-2-methylthio-N6-dimethylallyladenosine synthase
MPRSFYIHTFGCQMNVHDAETLAGLLRAAGFAAAASDSEADVVLIETCSVREHAEDRVWSLLGRLAQRKEHYPRTVIGVIGCMAEKERERIFRRAPCVDLVAGPGNLDRVPGILENLSVGAGLVLSGHDRHMEFPSSAADRGAHPWSAYLAVSRGCSNACSYCIVPSVRGAEQSRPPTEIVDEARRLVDAGAVEITLLGQNVDAYGKDLGGAGPDRPSLAGLIRELGGLEENGLRRLRFVTSHPRDMGEDLLRAMAEVPVVCPFLHVPAQSGSDRVLSAMRRGYDSARYREICAAARRVVPGVEIVSDFIVGFPGETGEDYAATERLVGEVRFQRIFGFRYSPRPGTHAAESLEDDVPLEVKKDRLNRLFAVQTEISRAQNEALVGRTLEVLVEGPSARDPQRLTGRTRTWRIATFPDDGTPPGSLVDVKVTAATALSLAGDRSR